MKLDRHMPRVPHWSAAPAMLIALMLLGGCDTLQSLSAGPQPGKQEEQAGRQEAQVVTDDLVGAASQALIAGRPGEALEQYQHILSIDPKNVEAQLGVGEASLALNDPDRARAAFSAVPAGSPFHARAVQGSGLAELAQNRAEEAALDLKSAVSADPRLWRAWNGLGLIHDFKHEWDEARSCYEKALSGAPKTGIVRNNIGFSLLAQQRYAAATEEFRAALREAPTLETAQNNLRLALAFQGRYREALAEVPKEGRAAQLNNVGYVALLRKDYAAAESYFSQAIEESPSYDDVAKQNLSRLKALEGQGTSPKAKSD